MSSGGVPTPKGVGTVVEPGGIEPPSRKRVFTTLRPFLIFELNGCSGDRSPSRIVYSESSISLFLIVSRLFRPSFSASVAKLR